MLKMHKKQQPNRNFSGRETYMKRKFIFLFYFVFIIFNQINAQWLKTNKPYNGDIFCLAVSPNETGGTNLFAGTNDGVFISTDNGTNWFPVNTGLARNVISIIISGNNLFAGTDGGVWKHPLSEMITSVDVLSSALPKHFNLGQNYPNPFNPVTTISFELPSKSFVSLKVFNGLGTEVASLVSEELSAANYTQKWNAGGLPSGVYFYRFEAENYSATTKLLL